MIEDRLLILGLRRGRPQALRQVYDKYKVEMLRLAVVLVGNTPTAEDIVHDVFVRFAQSADRIGLAGRLHRNSGAVSTPNPWTVWIMRLTGDSGPEILSKALAVSVEGTPGM